MEWFTLPSRSVEAFGSRGVRLDQATVVGRDDDFRIVVAHFEPGGIIGRHRTQIWQFFAVLSGRGWVSGKDAGSMPIGEGEAVLWEPGEEHQSTASEPMVALIVLCKSRPDLEATLRSIEAAAIN
jgi:quercetin dioxygenase-like cupin family protein